MPFPLFEEIIRGLGGPRAMFMFANQIRPPANYIFNMFLPERNEPTYTIDTATLLVRSTMAGMSGLDSPYAPGGIVELSKFMREVAKITIQSQLTEAALRRLQDIVMRMDANAQPTNEFLANEVLNFLQKVIVQPLHDRSEWLRAQALVNGKINWKFKDITLEVDYGIPDENILTARAGADAWDREDSKFWDDLRGLQSVLKYNVRAYIIHPDTLNAILRNDANRIEVTAQEGLFGTGSRTSIRRLIGDNDRPATDPRDTVELIAYGDEADVKDETAPRGFRSVPFMPKGKLLALAENTRGGYIPGEGSTPDPFQEKALGYTHVGPTTEGGGMPGIWAQLYTPENLQMQLHGRGVMNALPVIEVPEKVAVASSELGVPPPAP